MRVLLSDPTYDRPSGDSSDFLDQLKNAASSVHDQFSIEERNLGHGADWPMYLVAFAAAFLSGASIDKNLSAWISLATRFRKFLGWLRGKKVGYWVDDEASALLALDAVREAHPTDIEEAELVDSTFVPTASVTLANFEDPDFQPVGVHVHCFRISTASVYTVVVSTEGELEGITVVTPRDPLSKI
jgi:hypothetical protein